MATNADALAAHIARVCALLTFVCLFCVPGLVSAEQTGTVTATNLYVRNEASKNADALCSITKGTKVTILSKSGDWYKIKVGSTTGYAAASYIKEGTTGTAKSVDKSGLGTIASLGSAPAASEPGDTSNSVLKLQKALTIKGFYSGNLSGHYGDKTKEAVAAFQKSKGLSADGIAGKATIKALFGQDAAGAQESEKSYKTEKLSWFNGGSGKIPNGAQFTVKDVQTGKTFTAQRRYGSNHLDAEPVTGSDTKAMKAIYGGSWSWRRRPILVLYNEHVYGASMNGMPHADEDQKITGNNFDGVFCIHFSGSKTHESDKVDDEHQNCVAKALKASW